MLRGIYMIVRSCWMAFTAITRFPFMFFNALFFGKNSMYYPMFEIFFVPIKNFITLPFRTVRNYYKNRPVPTPAPTPEPTPIPTPEPTPEPTLCWNDNDLSDFRKKKQDVKATLEGIRKRVDETITRVNQGHDEVRKLNTQLNEKLAEISKDRSTVLKYPAIPEYEAPHELVSVDPFNGEPIHPDVMTQVWSVFSKKQSVITNWDGVYKGVQANISYRAKKPYPITQIRFGPTTNEDCAVKLFRLVFFGKDVKSYLLGSAVMELKRGYNEEQSFELPEIVEAEEVRIVVLENYGDSERTCFTGAKLYRA